MTPAAGPALTDAEVDAAIERLRPRDPTKLARAIYRAGFAAGLARAHGAVRDLPQCPREATGQLCACFGGNVARCPYAAPAPAAAPSKPKTTLCWKCNTEYAIDRPRCPCGAANANAMTDEQLADLAREIAAAPAPAPGAEDGPVPLSQLQRLVLQSERAAARIAELEREHKLADAGYDEAVRQLNAQTARADRLAEALRAVRLCASLSDVVRIATAALAGEDAP